MYIKHHKYRPLCSYLLTRCRGSNAASDDDSALDESEQLNLPLDVALRQLNVFKPGILCWISLRVILLSLPPGVIFVPTGTRLHVMIAFHDHSHSSASRYLTPGFFLYF
jgi:hypothetical protein